MAEAQRELISYKTVKSHHKTQESFTQWIREYLD